MVIDNWYRTFTEQGAAYVTVAEFPATDGKVIRFTDWIGSIPPDYEIGEHVRVLYNRENATKAYIYSWKRIWSVAKPP
jgi:hypothetical protein